MIDRQRVKQIARAASAGVALVFAATALHAAGPGDVIVACVSASGDLRIANDNYGCRRNETTLTWNVQGPAGAPGPAGAQGLAGPEGPAGRDGRDGRDGDPGTPPPSVTAQMRIDGVNGGTATPIGSFSLGATDTASTSSGGGAGSGKVTFSNLIVTKTLDGDSVPLLQAASTGQVLSRLSIDVFNVGSATPFATYTFENVVVTSTILGSPASLVGEQDAFDYRKITTDVTINGQTFHNCFDVKLSSSCS